MKGAVKLPSWTDSSVGQAAKEDLKVRPDSGISPAPGAAHNQSTASIK